jgi:cell volume regulation protein A
MNDVLQFGLIVTVCAAAAALALAYNRISEIVRVPAPAVFLLVAAIASDLVPSLERIEATTVQRVVTVGLAVILFDGGMHIGRRKFRTVAGTVAWIGVLGTFVTAAALTLLVHYVFDFDWLLALLLGTALSPTDPAVVFSVLGRREIAGRTGTILEGESGANDPVGIALMAALLTAGVAGGFEAVQKGLLEFVLQMAVGAAVGLALGALLLIGMRRWPLPTGALYPLRTLFGALLIYGVATVAEGSGFLAVFVAGILIGDARAPYKREIERFHSALASLAELIAFAVLGLTIDLAAIWRHAELLTGLAIAVLLALVVRPLVVGALLIPVSLRRNEKVFVLWAGLKGAVPILLGSFALEAHINGAQRLYDVIFVVVAFSVIVQGGLVPTVANKLAIPMRTVEPEPWAIGVRFKDEPQGLRRYVIAEGAAADGATVDDLALGEGFWISLVIRGGQLVHVGAGTELLAGDEVIALTDPEAEFDPSQLFGDTAEPLSGNESEPQRGRGRLRALFDPSKRHRDDSR